MAFHVLGMKGVFGGEVGRARRSRALEATQSTVNHFHAACCLGYVVYPSGLLASCYHLANGFWAAAITWGLTIGRTAQKRWGMACAGLFVLTFACGIAALVAVLRDQPRAIAAENVPTDVRVPVVESSDKK